MTQSEKIVQMKRWLKEGDDGVRVDGFHRSHVEDLVLIVENAQRENASLLGVLREMTYHDPEADNVYWKHNRQGVGIWLFGLLRPLHVAVASR